MDRVDETGLSYSHRPKEENPYLLRVGVEEEVLDVLEVRVSLSAQRRRRRSLTSPTNQTNQRNKQGRNNQGRNPEQNSPPPDGPPRLGLGPQGSHGWRRTQRRGRQSQHKVNTTPPTVAVACRHRAERLIDWRPINQSGGFLSRTAKDMKVLLLLLLNLLPPRAIAESVSCPQDGAKPQACLQVNVNVEVGTHLN